MLLLLKELNEKAKTISKEKVAVLQHFFKTNKGEYGEGDVFIGFTVPESREFVKKYYKELTLDDIAELLKNKIHEYRLIALLSLLSKYEKTKDLEEKEKYVNFYLSNTKYINNWDLVDLTCYKLLGDYLYNYKNKNIDILLKLSKSNDLWERRIAVISTMYFVKQGCLEPSIQIINILLQNKEDLIHKANGWILRELGKKDPEILKKYLDKNIYIMPRTTLRYAIEKFDEETKKYYLKIK